MLIFCYQLSHIQKSIAIWKPELKRYTGLVQQIKETRRCAVTLGMKKTSVDQLTKAVGIAKGSSCKRKCFSSRFWRTFTPSFTEWLTMH